MVLEYTPLDAYYAYVLIKIYNNESKGINPYKNMLSINDCNKCKNCLDKVKNGGTGKRKKSCKNTIFLNKYY
jgi:hypothetical protein